MSYIITHATEDEIAILNREGFNYHYATRRINSDDDIVIEGDRTYYNMALHAIRRSSKLMAWRPDDGKHAVADCLPEPEVMLKIYCAENADHVGGGAATLGKDGKWYWTHNGEIAEECTYPVTHWCYL